MNKEYRKIDGANEQQEYVINRLRNMETASDEDKIFKYICLDAVYKLFENK